MGLFTDVIAGGLMRASDMNQLVDALNGTVATTLAPGAAAAGTVPWQAVLPAAVAAGTPWFDGRQSGDALGRVRVYVNSGGYGCIAASTGTGSYTNHLEGSSGGWTYLESPVFAGSVTINGTTTLNGLTFTGNVATTGSNNMSGTTYNLDAGALTSAAIWNTGGAGAGLNIGSATGRVSLIANQAGATRRQLVLAANNAGSIVNCVQCPDTGGGNILGTAVFSRFSNTTVRAVSGWSQVSITGGFGTVSHGLGTTPTGGVDCTGNTTTQDAWATTSVSNIGSSTLRVNVSDAGTWSTYGLVMAA